MDFDRRNEQIGIVGPLVIDLEVDHDPVQRADAMCVLHTHTVAGVAVSCQKQGLPPLNQWSLQFTDRLAYHDYEGIALDLDERARLVADLGDKFVIILQ
jgi:ribulose-5-phosphate 4-epimerase/fuculose-1-phosphate aldolase